MSSNYIIVDVIPDKLQVLIYTHDLPINPEPIKCWTYITSGLSAHKHKEISFTLRREKEEKESDFPLDPINLFRTIYDLASSGTTANYGARTVFGGDGP